MPRLQEQNQEGLQVIPPPRPTPIVLPGGANQKQRRQMLIALLLLLVALALVIVKDRHFWFPPAPVTQATSVQQSPATTAPVVKNSPAPAQPLIKTKTRSKIAAKTAAAPAPGISPVVTSRAVLPPLEVEVVAGDQHRTINPGSNSVRVDVQPNEPVSSTASSVGVVTNASESMRISADTAQAVVHPVRPEYPMLAKQMRVQGSVVLQALIGKDGSIQDLHVLSGPDILSSAAMEAVKQWRFKPYYQNGAPVDTEAHITVNFTISTY